MKKIGFLLLRVVLPLLILTAAGFGVWHFFGDSILASLQTGNSSSEFYTYEEYLEIQEKTAELRDLLKKANGHFLHENTVSCTVQTRSVDADIPFFFRCSDTTAVYDAAQDLWMHTEQDNVWTKTTLYRRNTELTKHEMWWYYTDADPDIELAVDHYDESGNITFYPAEVQTWYHTYCTAPYLSDLFEKGTYSIYPVKLAAELDILDYEVLDDKDGVTHYLVTHTPLYRNGKAANDPVKEYFPNGINEATQENFPELCERFLELLDHHYHTPGQSHLWIDEEGRLLRAEIDCTVEAYAKMFLADPISIQEYAAQSDLAPAEWQMFFGTVPLKRIITYQYGENSAEVKLPDSCISYVTP